MSDPRRDLWVAEFESEMVQLVGREWPTLVIVTMWERNDIGERRYVGTRTYVPSGGLLVDQEPSDETREP